jgi:hypothetical protein
MTTNGYSRTENLAIMDMTSNGYSGTVSRAIIDMTSNGYSGTDNRATINMLANGYSRLCAILSNYELRTPTNIKISPCL